MYAMRCVYAVQKKTATPKDLYRDVFEGPLSISLLLFLLGERSPSSGPDGERPSAFALALPIGRGESGVPGVLSYGSSSSSKREL